MLMSELAHMKKLYNDIIYFVQNHVKPVAPSNSYPHSVSLHPSSSVTGNHGAMLQQKGLNNQQIVGYQKQGNEGTKLFGVPIQYSKKRVHPMEMSGSTNKARFELENDDLGFNLMPPSHC